MSEGAYGTATLPARAVALRARRSPTAVPLAVALLCALAGAVLWAVAVHVPAAETRDGALLRHFLSLGSPHIDHAARVLVHSLNPLPYLFWAGALLCVALFRGRPRDALAAAAVMGLAVLTSETLKPLLGGEPRFFVGPSSWPSGHTTAATALVAAAVIVAPPRLRVPVALAGAAFALAVGCALLILGLHLPSDVLGGYLVVGFWAALAAAVLRSGARLPRRAARDSD